MALVAALAAFVLRGVGLARNYWIDRAAVIEARYYVELYRLAQEAGFAKNIKNLQDLEQAYSKRDSELAGLSFDTFQSGAAIEFDSNGIPHASVALKQLTMPYGADYDSNTGMASVYSRITNANILLYAHSARMEKRIFHGQ